MDSRGRLLSLWWFLIMAVIAGGLVIGVSMYYSASIDVRDLEATILRDNLKSCLADGGFVHNGLLNDTFDIYKECGLAKNVFQRDSNFFFSAVVFNDSGMAREIYGGQRAFEKDCQISGVIEAANYPRCSNTTVYGISRNGGETKMFRIEINAGSNQAGGRVPAE